MPGAGPSSPRIDVPQQYNSPRPVMPHACPAPAARRVNWGATVMVACATNSSIVAVNTEVPGASALTVPGPLMERTDGTEEVKVIEGFVISRPCASTAVTGTMSVSSTSSVVSRIASSGTPGAVLSLQPVAVTVPRTIQ